MIVGVGLDLIETSRVAAAIDGSGERFLERLFTPSERADCEGRRDEVALLAERFAAKEALLKAIGTGWSGGARWKEAEVRLDRRGRPLLHLSGKTAEIARSAGANRVHLSLGRAHDMAAALVILEREGTP